MPIQYPIVCGPNFNAMIDVLLMKMYSWGPEGGTPTITDIPADQKEKALELHKQLVEAAAENDEALMEKFFDKGTLTEDEMQRGHTQRSHHPRHLPCILRERTARHGRAPYDGIPGQLSYRS